MTNDERDELLIRIDERLKVIDSKLASDYKCLHGNGQPGLLTRVQMLEDQHQHESKGKAAVLAWLALFVSAVSAIVASINQSK